MNFIMTILMIIIHTPAMGGVELNLIDGLISLFVVGSRYYYCDGVYYTRGRHGYVVVVPPPGAVIRDIPPYYQPIIINGVPYYTSDGIYYQYTPRGYVVVPQPGVTVVQPAHVIAPAVQTQNIVKSQSTVETQGTEESFTVNIPNSKGGYTAVVLKRSEDDFVGPPGRVLSRIPLRSSSCGSCMDVRMLF